MRVKLEQMRVFNVETNKCPGFTLKKNYIGSNNEINNNNN